MSTKVRELSKEIRFQVFELEDGQTFAFVQDLVVALVDVYVRFGRVWPEMFSRWYAQGTIGGRDCRYADWLGEMFDTISEMFDSIGEMFNTIGKIAEYSDTGIDLFPSLLEKLGQKQDSEHCPVCQHLRFRDCWYCREGFGETEELKSYSEE